MNPQNGVFDPNSLLMINQANQVPPDQAQLKAQADAAGVPMYLMPNQARAPQAAAPEAAAPPMQQAPPPPPSAMPEQPQGLSRYMPVTHMDDGYKAAAGQARLQQQGNLDDIQKYINGLKDQPQGINWSPLAALVDSFNPGKSNLAAAAEKMAPMTPDARQKMLTELQLKLGGERNQLSRENLASLAQQLNYSRQTAHDAEIERHNAALEGVGMGRNQVMLGRMGIQMDNQANKAADTFDHDQILTTAQKQQNQIGLDSHTLNNPNTVVNSAIRNEISTGIANALAGGKAASLEATKMQQIHSVANEWADFEATVKDKPVSALSDANRAQLQSILSRLHEGYGNITAARAAQLRDGRSFQNNAHANEVMDNKVKTYTGSGAPAGSAPQYDADILSYAKDHNITPEQAANVKKQRGG